jgi:carbon monoxide dehydrogenase subunit G
MRIENQRELPCGQTQAWLALNDIEVLQDCIPGCESLLRLGDDEMQMVVMAAVGPVRARFTGKLSLQDVQPPASYALVFQGQGGVAGFGKGRALVRLETLGERCRLHYSADLQIGGKLAQIGSRVVEGAAQKLIGDFFARFEARVQAPNLAQGPTADAAAQPPSAAQRPPAKGWQRLWNRLRAWLARAPGLA